MQKVFDTILKIIDVLFVVVSAVFTLWMYPLFLASAFLWKWTFEGDECNRVKTETILKPNFNTAGRFFTMIWAMVILTAAYKAFLEFLINAFS